MINAMTLILTSIFLFCNFDIVNYPALFFFFFFLGGGGGGMGTFPVLPLTVFTFLNLFALLDCVVM